MVRLQPLVRHRLATLGDAGARWRDDLPAVLDDLAGRWGFEPVRGLPGGSASYVAEVRTETGPRVLKVGVPVPGEPGVADEARVLGAAQGRGYALLHAYAADHGALLLERLGRSLEQTPGEPGTRLDRLVDVLREAWTAPLVGERVAKAEQLADLVEGGGRRHGCDPAVLRQALAYAEELAEPGPDGEVLLHGDAHPGNALRRDGGGHALVDPDGFVGDPAYDAGVTLREWNVRLADEGRPLLERLCDRVAERAGLDRERTWRWAFLERVSTGLYVLDLGAERVGRPFLETARLLVDGLANPVPTRRS